MIIDRKYDREEVLKRIQYYPVTAIIGPRQSGKTTLAKMLSPDSIYDLENSILQLDRKN